jgi:ankyrin repeat protein
MIKAIDSLLLQDTSAEEIYQMFQLIIKKGTLLNIQDRRGNTPINYTSQQAKSTKPGYEVYTKVGKIILALDVNVSETIQIKNNMGKSPLDYLSRNGNVILRDAVFSKLPHIQEAINRTMAETETATHKILRSTSDKVLP